MKSARFINAPVEAKSQQTPAERRWLTVAEVAEELGCHPISVYRLCGWRKMPYAKAAGVGIRIDRGDLERFMQGSKIPARRKAKF
jgi:excisionase family DNA binding protein